MQHLDLGGSLSKPLVIINISLICISSILKDLEHSKPVAVQIPALLYHLSCSGIFPLKVEQLIALSKFRSCFIERFSFLTEGEQGQIPGSPTGSVASWCVLATWVLV